MSELTHLGDDGRARMIDVGAKPTSERRAVARARLRMAPETARAVAWREQVWTQKRRVP